MNDSKARETAGGIALKMQSVNPLKFTHLLKENIKCVAKKVPGTPFLYFLSKHPANLRKNLNSCRYIMSVGRKEEINYVPPVFGAAISTACNLRCPTCLYLLKNPNSFDNGGFMEVNNFRRVMDRYAPTIEMVGLGGGEPLLHPELGKLLEIIRSKGLPANMSTNGILIKHRIELLKAFDINLNVSMDSYDHQSFKRYRGGTAEQFDSILEGLALLRKNGIKFMLSFLLSEGNIGEVLEMIKFGYKTRPHAIIFYNINPHGSGKLKPLTRESKAVDRVLNEITSRSDYPFNIQLPVVFDTASKYFKTSRCAQPWSDCGFDNKGNISFCCHIEHDAGVGNMFEGYDFNSDEMKKFRRSIINNEPPEDCLFCDRRFPGGGYGFFNAELGRWI